MGHHNAIEADNPEQDNEMNQNRVDMAGAILPNNASPPPPPVFKLYVNYWDDVFDWLSVEDVHAFGRTCKAFQRVAGEYFKAKYTAFDFWCDGHPTDSQLAIFDFVEYIPKIAFLPRSVDSKWANHVTSKCKALKHMHLDQFYPTKPFVEAVKHALPTLESIHSVDGHGYIYEDLLKHCVNLKFRFGIPFGLSTSKIFCASAPRYMHGRNV